MKIVHSLSKVHYHLDNTNPYTLNAFMAPRKYLFPEAGK